MRTTRVILRPIAAAIAVLTLLTACSPPPSVYSRNPVDESGTPLRGQRLVGLELRDHTRYELAEGESLHIEGAALVIRSRVREDGSRRQRAFELDEVELLKVHHEDGREVWYPVATPTDLMEQDTLPHLRQIRMVDGEIIDVDRGTQTRWSANRLEILVGPKSADESDLRPLPLDQIETVEVADTNPLKATLLSPKFWVVAGAAVVLAWFLAGREDSDNIAVE
jgi:hypothetical protein